MDVETETLNLSVTKQTAALLYALTEATNSSIHNLADRALRRGLSAIADERVDKLATSRGEHGA